MTGESVDFLILGGGLFGSFASLALAARGHSVMLVERDRKLFGRASVVNQARLHLGYHYPRSIATARSSLENYDRFLRDHEPFVNAAFRHYYAIDRFGSLTDASQFERFCAALGIPALRIPPKPFMVADRLEAVYETREPSFDPLQLRQHYGNALLGSTVQVRLATRVAAAEARADHWEVELSSQDVVPTSRVYAGCVVNATYSAINEVNRVFGQPLLDATHEHSEVVLLQSRALQGHALTVMDGPFCSIMPYGNSGFHSLTSVLYTHHWKRNAAAEALERPPQRSNVRKMLAQARHYIRSDVDLGVRGSLMTVKTKLASSAIDDSRPTEIRRMNDSPPYYCLFSGKINSIYEIEKVIRDA